MEWRVTDGTGEADDTLVLFIGADGRLSRTAQAHDEASEGLIRRVAEREPKTRKHGRIDHLLMPARLPQEHLLVVTIGKDRPLTHLELEELGGSILQRLRGLKVSCATLGSTDGLEIGPQAEAAALALAQGIVLRNYRFERYRVSVEEADKVPDLTRVSVTATDPNGALSAELAKLEPRRRAVHRARDLVSEPANVLGPAELAAACRELEPLGVEVEVMDEAKLRELGMRALLGVAQGSVRPPHVVVMRWRGATTSAPLALVGKGVCFDSGGLSIKPAGGMEDMKWDMAGAAAVFGTMMALAGRRAPADVVGIIGLAENMPSGTAQRPGDVVKAMSGKTIEVINTDAEGRLLLADVLWYAKETFKPKAIIDLATLTGAIVVALGHERAGLFANDEALAASLIAAGDAVGERLWRMPLGKEYDKHIKSEIADIKNVGRARQAGATAGAVFLQQFIGEVPWAHLDIAGVAWSGRDLPLAPKGATAFGVRLLDRLVADAYEGG